MNYTLVIGEVCHFYACTTVNFLKESVVIHGEIISWPNLVSYRFLFGHLCNVHFFNFNLNLPKKQEVTGPTEHIKIMYTQIVKS